jgi:uncharacterized Zn finger protein (UPF0148 family)
MRHFHSQLENMLNTICKACGDPLPEKSRSIVCSECKLLDEDYDPKEEAANDYSGKVDDEILRRVDP